jgi:hypothetical protein
MGTLLGRRVRRAVAPGWAAGRVSGREARVGVYIYIVITDAQHPVFSDSTTFECKQQIRRSPPSGWPAGTRLGAPRVSTASISNTRGIEESPLALTAQGIGEGSSMSTAGDIGEDQAAMRATTGVAKRSPK